MWVSGVAFCVAVGGVPSPGWECPPYALAVSMAARERMPCSSCCVRSLMCSRRCAAAASPQHVFL
eukprot:1553402-Rhodomonas_salina.1